MVQNSFTKLSFYNPEVPERSFFGQTSDNEAYSDFRARLMETIH